MVAGKERNRDVASATDFRKRQEAHCAPRLKGAPDVGNDYLLREVAGEVGEAVSHI